jgi:hypothetical protein
MKVDQGRLAGGRQRATVGAGGAAMRDEQDQLSVEDALATMKAALDGTSVVDPQVHERADRVVRVAIEDGLAEHRRQQIALQRPLVSALASLLLADLQRNPIAEPGE